MPNAFAQLRHLSVAVEYIYLHPDVNDGERPFAPDVIGRPANWPFLRKSTSTRFQELRLPRGMGVDGMQCSIFSSGAVFYGERAHFEAMAIVGAASYQCIFERIEPAEFQNRLPMLASGLRGFDRRFNRYAGRGTRLEQVFVVDQIEPGSSKWKLTLLICAMIGSTIAGTATLLAQYPAIREGAVLLMQDAGFVARELEPVERSMCEPEYDA